MRLEYYEILNSRFALEHRYTTNGSKLGMDLMNEHDKCKAHMRVTRNYGSFDVTVFASGRPFHAHRVVLACRSPEFRRLIESSWRGPTYHSELLLPDISAEVMKHVIEFMYVVFKREARDF